MSKAAAIEFLKEQLLASESERKKVLAAIQTAQSRLPQLDAEISATNLLISKHTGEPRQLPLSVKPAQQENHLVEGSIAMLIFKALSEAQKPQRYEQLLAFLASHGKHPSNATLRSTIHQYVKRGKLFKSVQPGVCGLLEWDTRN